jgi:hypothetical protein
MPSMIASKPSFIPDGFAVAREGRDVARLESRVSSGRDRFAPARSPSPAGSRGDLAEYHNQDGYDEGLVHSHGWACNR